MQKINSDIAGNRELKYDIFRGEVIGLVGSTISVTEYPTELFKVYRSGSVEGSSMTLVINRKYVLDAFQRTKESDALKKQVETNRMDAEKAYRKIEDSVKKIDHIISSRDIDNLIVNMPAGVNISSDEINSGRELSAGFAAQMNKYVQEKVSEIQNFSSIHIQAFAAKLDAIRSCCSQDMNTLNQAYNVIKGYEKEG